MKPPLRSGLLHQKLFLSETLSARVRFLLGLMDQMQTGRCNVTRLPITHIGCHLRFWPTLQKLRDSSKVRKPSSTFLDTPLRNRSPSRSILPPNTLGIASPPQQQVYKLGEHNKHFIKVKKKTNIL